MKRQALCHLSVEGDKAHEPPSEFNQKIKIIQQQGRIEMQAGVYVSARAPSVCLLSAHARAQAETWPHFA